MNNKIYPGCGCSGGRQRRWIEPSILYLLSKASRHGYELMNELPALGFVTGTADPAAIYRNLKHLEDCGQVLSKWYTPDSGPAKKLYTITEQGRINLKLWYKTMKTQKTALETLMNLIDEM